MARTYSLNRNGPLMAMGLLLTVGLHQGMAQVYTMTNGSASTCSGIFYDSGGATGNYSNGENRTFTICPLTLTQKVRVSFTAFNVETNYDYLRIYDGNSTATLIGSYTGGSANGQTFTSTHSSGCLTFVFTSDVSVTRSGWTANIACINTVVPEVCGNGLDDDGDGLVDCNDPDCFSSDNDGDSICDEPDLDDDNDGIPDLVECPWIGIDFELANGSLELVDMATHDDAAYDLETPLTGIAVIPDVYVPGWNSSASDMRIEVWANSQSVLPGVTAFDGTQWCELNATEPAGIYQDVATTPGATVTWSLRHRSRTGGVEQMTILIGPPGGTLASQGTYAAGVGFWQLHSGSYVVPSGQTMTRFTFNAVGGTTLGNFLDDLRFSSTPDFGVLCDTDDDGIPDFLDLDSDNDGIYDLVEAGHGETDADNNGIIDGAASAFGINGLFDGVETSADSGTLNYTVSDSDSDGNIDSVELDSDGDLCNDVIEAGYTDHNDDGELGDVPLTVDGDGLVTSGGP